MDKEKNIEEIKKESESRDELKNWALQYSQAPISTFEKITGFLETVEQYSKYTDEQIVEILKGTSVNQKIKLSNYFYESNDLYKTIINYLASYFLYYQKLEYHPLNTKVGFSKDEYVNGLKTMGNLNISSYSYQIMLTTLREGAFYGVVNFDKDGGYAVIKLPNMWCNPAGIDRKGLKNFGIDLREVENSIRSQRGGDLLEQVKQSFPKEVYRAWQKYQKDKSESNRYCLITSDIGICFNLFDTVFPPMINVIEDIQAYSKTKTIEYFTALDELRKIIVQKFPLGKDDMPVISIPEMKDFHRLVGNMLKNNPYVDLISTVADVEKIQMQDSNKVQDSKMSNRKESIYDSVGLPHLLFSPSGNTSLKQAIIKDGALLTNGINYLSNWFSQQVNIMNDIWYKKKKKDNFFEVSILILSHYNRDEYIKQSLEAARSGFDIFTPGIALGQTHLQVYSSIMVNYELDLVEKMKPLKSSYTTSNTGGPEEKTEDNKDDKTIENNNGEMEV